MARVVPLSGNDWALQAKLVEEITERRGSNMILLVTLLRLSCFRVLVVRAFYMPVQFSRH